MYDDFRIEKKLVAENPDLHSRMKSSLFALNSILERYKLIFPSYTDHTILHSMNVINFCNQLIGEFLDKLNADELYILLMSCYLHDTGMGLNHNDYSNFRKFLKLPEVNENSVAEQIRKNHNDFSGEFIKKYSGFFDIPSKEHEFSIIQVARGHRKTDLFDEHEYPSDLKVPGGNTVCLPYLAALIRLADEVDVAADRNIPILFDSSVLYPEESMMAFASHDAIKHLEILPESFEIYVDTSDSAVFDFILKQNEKVADTVSYCAEVVQARTPYRINQTKITVHKI